MTTIDSTAKKMSLREYQKARGHRSYDIGKDLENQRKGKVKTPAEIRIQEQSPSYNSPTPVNISNALEAELDVEHSVAFRTSTNFSTIQKPQRDSVDMGKISMNPELVSTNTGRHLRTSMEKTDYLKNLLYKRDGELNSSLDFSRTNNNFKIVDNLNQGIGLHSVNPRAHSYAKEVDFIKPRRLNKMMLQ